MKRSVWRAVATCLVVSILAVSLTSCGGGKKKLAKELHLYNWSEYIEPQVLEDFEAALPAETADTTTIPDTGSKRIPTTGLSGCGFCHAQSQLTHGPLYGHSVRGPMSAATTRVWLRPHSVINCSCAARCG